jgi:hypothetical protein
MYKRSLFVDHNQKPWVEAVAQAHLQCKALTGAEILALRLPDVVSPIPPFGPHGPSSS